MRIVVCSRADAFSIDRFVPDHMVSIQNPGTDTSDLRPPWVSVENHYVGYFFDIDTPNDPSAPSVRTVKMLIDWLEPRCGPSSKARFLIHCDAGMGRSPAVAYVAWSIHLGAGFEREAFRAMRRSCLEREIFPNASVIAHADRLLHRHGAIRQQLKAWYRTMGAR
jgi:predicted protein tyrosine phosphatase